MSHRTLLLAVLSLAYVGSAVANPHVRVTRIEPYYENDVAHVAPPEGTGLAPFVIPTFRGKLRLGAPNSYRTETYRNDPEVYRDIAQRNEGLANKTKGQSIYLALMAFSEHKPRIAIPLLRDALVSGGNAATARYVDFNGDWPTHLHFLGMTLTTNDEFRRFFCDASLPCALDTNGGTRPFTGVGARFVPFWGGDKNEFRARASYREFVDQYAARLFAWGESLDRNVYLVAPLGPSEGHEYRFDRAGYVFRVNTPLPLAAQHPRSTIKRPTHTVSFMPGGNATPIEIFLPMDADRGEAMFQQIRARPRDRLFAAYAARLTRAVRMQGQQYPTHRLGVELEHVITGDAIEIFFGDALQESFLRIELK